MKRTLVLAGAVSACALLSAAAAPASAASFFSYGADQDENFAFTGATAGPGGSFTITGAITYTILSGPYAGFADFGTVDITGSTTDAVQINGAGSYTLGGFSGTISFDDTDDQFPPDIFTGSYSNATLYINPGSSSFGGSAVYDEYLNPNPATISYSSTYIPFGSSLTNAFSIVLSDLSAVIPTGSSANKTFKNFTGEGAGSFESGSDAVPEPAAWTMMLIGFGAVGGLMRRRRVIAAN